MSDLGFDQGRRETPIPSTHPHSEDEEGSSVSNLPSGIHPLDPSVPYVSGDLDSNNPVGVPQEKAGNKFKTGQPSFNTDSEDALAVFQRASQAWSGNSYSLSGAQPIVGRQKGRIEVHIWVSSTSALGVQIAPSASEVEATVGEIILNPGDSITLATEAPVWAAPIPGNATGSVNVVVIFNPAGGPLGNL
jgi:hypothetical protein